MNEMIKTSAENLEKNGFEVYTVATAREAREKALSLIREGWSVGVGGSMSIRQLGLAETLEEKGHKVWWHWTSPEEKAVVWSGARNADVYLASANAVTRAGQLVNIDGTGNRVASMIHGPATVLTVVGSQKIVEGGITAAIARIKREACPPNASRLGLDTPCGTTGKCDEANCGDSCMCRAITVTNRPLRGQRYIVILVEESIGY